MKGVIMFLKSLIIAVLFLIAIGLVVAGCSKHRWSTKTPEEKAQWITEKISSELDLDDNQYARLQQIKSDILTEYKNHGDFKQDLWQELDHQLATDSIDQQSMNETFAAKEKQFSAMRTVLVDKFAEFYAVLSAEQRAKLADKIEKVHNRWKH
jgi:uncharacterized membrane protein